MLNPHSLCRLLLPRISLALALAGSVSPVEAVAQSWAETSTLSIHPRQLLAAMPAPPAPAKLTLSRADTDTGGDGFPVTVARRSFEWTPPESETPVQVSLTVIDLTAQRPNIQELRKQFSQTPPSGAESIRLTLPGPFEGHLKASGDAGQRFEAIGAKRLLVKVNMQPSSTEQAQQILKALDFAALGKLESTVRSERFNPEEGFPMVRMDELNPQLNRQTVMRIVELEWDDE